MFDAQYVLEGDTVLSPWMPRHGDRALIFLDLISISDDTSSVIVEMYEKNSEDAGDGTVATGTEIDLTEPGISGTFYGPFKELVRYKISYGSTSGSDYALLRMLPMVWYDAVKA